MSSTHSRNVSASATDRRSVNLGGTGSRYMSTRTSDYEKPHVRDSGSPVPSDVYGNGSSTGGLSQKLRRDVNEKEYRSDRTVVTTKERIVTTKSPAKASVEAGTRGDVASNRRVAEDIHSRRKQENTAQREGGCWHLQEYTNTPYSTMANLSIPFVTLIRPSRQPDLKGSLISSASHRSSTNATL